jgi:hypothetical protein
MLKHIKPDAASLRIWGCKAWKLIPPARRSHTYLPILSEELRFLGLAWPDPKAYRVLTSKGNVETSRHVQFDESAPPVCYSRADFSPFMVTEIARIPPSAVQPIQPQPAPSAPVPPAATQEAPPPPLTRFLPLRTMMT